jgi:hypothetical protein
VRPCSHRLQASANASLSFPKGCSGNVITSRNNIRRVPLTETHQTHDTRWFTTCTRLHLHLVQGAAWRACLGQRCTSHSSTKECVPYSFIACDVHSFLAEPEQRPHATGTRHCQVVDVAIVFMIAALSAIRLSARRCR